MSVSTVRGAPPGTPGGQPDTMRHMQLSVGETVHYRSHGSAPGLDGVQVHKSRCRAAIVTDELSDSMRSLAVINPAGIFFDDCRYDEHMTGGTWHLPNAGIMPCD